MEPWFTAQFGNPSSSYKIGRTAKTAVAEARKQTAALIGADPDEVFFTSCGTESNNWAVKGSAAEAIRQGNGRKRFLVSDVEHPAVLRTCEALTPFGFVTEQIPVDEDGVVSVEALRGMAGEDCVLVCVMHANNETGVIQPVRECAEIAHTCGARFLTDAVQSTGHIPVDVKTLGCDFLSLSGHKFGAPKGIGALYVKKGIMLPPLIDGGGQEKGMRSGTENVPYIVGLGEACRIAAEQLSAGEGKRLAALRDRIAEKLLALGHCRINGDNAARVPGTLNISFACVEGESLMLLCDMHGVCLSTGSACSNGLGDEVSHVLRAMKVPAAYANGSVRISIGAGTSEADADAIADTVASCAAKLRAVSDEWERMTQ